MSDLQDVRYVCRPRSANVRARRFDRIEIANNHRLVSRNCAASPAIQIALAAIQNGLAV